MIAIFYLVLQLLKLYSYIVIANVVVSWLVAFNVFLLCFSLPRGAENRPPEGRKSTPSADAWRQDLDSWRYVGSPGMSASRRSPITSLDDSITQHGPNNQVYSCGVLRQSKLVLIVVCWSVCWLLFVDCGLFVVVVCCVRCCTSVSFGNSAY